MIIENYYSILHLFCCISDQFINIYYCTCACMWKNGNWRSILILPKLLLFLTEVSLIFSPPPHREMSYTSFYVVSKINTQGICVYFILLINTTLFKEFILQCIFQV